MMRSLISVAATLASAAAATPGLYGLDPQQTLLAVYPNATTSAIGPAHPSLLQAQQLSALDEANQILYFIGYQLSNSTAMFTGLDLNTGAVTSSVPIPFSDSAFIGVGQMMAWEPNSQRLICGGQLADQTHVIGLIDPITGAYTQVANITKSDLDVLGGSGTYADSTNSYIFQLGVGDGITTFSVNLQTGALASSATANIDTMDFDPVTGQVFGLGLDIDGNAWNRTLVSMDPNTLAVTTVGVITGYGIESGGIAAIDVADRSLYWIGQQTNAGPNDPFYLIQVDLKDASIISTGRLCSDDAACPWSLEYLNKQF